jgi:hypothetical protein
MFFLSEMSLAIGDDFSHVGFILVCVFGLVLAVSSLRSVNREEGKEGRKEGREGRETRSTLSGFRLRISTIFLPDS